MHPCNTKKQNNEQVTTIVLDSHVILNTHPSYFNPLHSHFPFNSQDPIRSIYTPTQQTPYTLPFDSCHISHSLSNTEGYIDLMIENRGYFRHRMIRVIGKEWMPGGIKKYDFYRKAIDGLQTKTSVGGLSESRWWLLKC